MQAYKGLGPLFIITRQTTKARCPRVTALHYPALGQQHKAFFGLGQFHHFELQAVGLSILGGLCP